MATVTTYRRTDEVAGEIVIEDKSTVVRASATADDFTLPAGAPVGFSFTLQNIGAGVQTLTAPSGDSMDGSVTTIAQDESVFVSKTTSDTWVATPYAAADA